AARRSIRLSLFGRRIPVRRLWTAGAEALRLAERRRGAVGPANRLDAGVNVLLQHCGVQGHARVDDHVGLAGLAARRLRQLGPAAAGDEVGHAEEPFPQADRFEMGDLRAGALQAALQVADDVQEQGVERKRPGRAYVDAAVEPAQLRFALGVDVVV